jgi:hypothetical protein
VEGSSADDWTRIRDALEALPIDVGPELASKVLHTVLSVASELNCRHMMRGTLNSR